MKKISSLITVVILFVFVVFCFVPAYGNDKVIRVLFIGNSLTSANNLPGMVADIAKSHGYRLIYDSYTPGGARLANHSADERVLRKIKEGPWDFVVFQEQSQYPGFSKKQLSKDVFPYAKNLSEMVRNSDTTNQKL